jgi:ribonuclease HII
MLSERSHSDLLAIEHKLWQSGFSRIAGVDEVGRGPFAGPVVAAAVILPVWSDIPGVIDSKKMTPKSRKAAYHTILNQCNPNVAIGAASAQLIDQIGLLKASLLAMKRAILKLNPSPDYILVDGLYVPEGLDIESEPIVGGDGKSRSIAAASVVAKVVRDRLMVNLDRIYPEFRFASNKGYGTLAHRQALQKYGPTRHHRYSFKPVQQVSLQFKDKL